MIHTHKRITLADLRRLKIPPIADAGENWRGIPHAQTVSAVICEAEARSISVSSLDIALSGARTGDQSEMASSFGLVFPHCTPPKGMQFSLGIITSNAQRYASCAYLGVITEAEAGIPIVELNWKKRHTTHFDMETAIGELFDRVEDSLSIIPERISRLQQMVLTEEESMALLVQSGRLTCYTAFGNKQIMPWSRIGRVDAQYHAYKERNAWNLLESFALIARMNPPLEQILQVYRFYSLLTDRRQT